MTVVGLSAILLAATACGGDEATPVEAGTTVPSSTVPPSTVPPSTAAPASGPARTVSRGEAFTVSVGESVGVAGEGLVVTYSQFVSDNRCPIGVQCITAGNAVIVVDLVKTGGSPAGLTLNTTEGPTSAGYLDYTVTLVQLSRGGGSPPASLRVS